MWKKQLTEIDYTEKFGELTNEKIDKMLSNFSNLEIEDKLDYLFYIFDYMRLDKTYFDIIKNHALSNNDIRYHMELTKSSNNLFLQLIYRKKTLSALEELSEKIKICKDYLVFKKIGEEASGIGEASSGKVKEISNFFETDMQIIINSIIISVRKNNSFDCDEDILNSIKAFEREEKMDNFLKLF